MNLTILFGILSVIIVIYIIATPRNILASFLISVFFASVILLGIFFLDKSFNYAIINSIITLSIEFFAPFFSNYSISVIAERRIIIWLIYFVFFIALIISSRLVLQTFYLGRNPTIDVSFSKVLEKVILKVFSAFYLLSTLFLTICFLAPLSSVPLGLLEEVFAWLYGVIVI